MSFSDTDTGLGYGVEGSSNAGLGVRGSSNTGYGVLGSSNTIGVRGSSNTGYGVEGSSSTGTGVVGSGSYGTSGLGANISVYAHNTTVPGHDAYLGTQALAADFYGDVGVRGNLYKDGGGFQVDHPLEPTKKYLFHSFVESPDMKNIYDGIVVLDTDGEASVELPSWFETLNKDFRYQLTCLGGYAPVYISQEIHNHRFTIAGGKTGMKVSWQVTGIRQDAWANANRIQVESEKSLEEQGFYLHPDLYNEPVEKHIQRIRYPESVQPRLLT